MSIKTKALVIREQNVGESDRLVTLLSADYGLIRAFVKRANVLKNNLASSTSLFSYATFTLYKGKDAYSVNAVEPIEIFFDLRKDIVKLSLAQYFAQLAFDLAYEEQPEEEMLSVMLNALHLLCNSNKDLRIVKSTVETRFMSLGGYMPRVLACANCATYESDIMFFDPLYGSIYCSNCGNENTMIKCNKNVITALRFICLTEPKKIFSFTLSEENLDALSKMTEQYVLKQLQKRFQTLEFYKGLL